MKKKILSIFMAVLIIVLMLPTAAFADETLQGDTDNSGTVDVNMTISEGQNGFYETYTGEALFHALLKVPYFDIALYGLEDYYYNPDCYTGGTQEPGTKQSAEGIVTSMHIFIYATEKYMLGVKDEYLGKGKYNDELFEYISWSQGAGSSFMSFWNGSTNLNYYLDYMYPLGRPGHGSTSDQQALHDGSKIDIHLIADKYAKGSGYSFFKTEDGTFDMAETTEGESITLTLQKTLSGYNSDTETEFFEALPGVETFYAAKEDYVNQDVGTEGWISLGTTDENGKVTIPSNLAAGTYYVSCLGEVIDNSERGPAAFILEVKESASEEKINYGDVNGDEKVNPVDIVLLRKYLLNKEKYPLTDEKAADVNVDGKVNPVDIVLLRKYLLNSEKYPLG
ncbi:MAG: hypothetical protein IKL18_00840 [Oscillospiraceae bacterium]|nr:hypothetical protein [Oscillospiraceae bacterium]